MLSKTVVKARPSVLWCYKKELYMSSHKKKRMAQIKKMAQVGVLGCYGRLLGVLGRVCWKAGVLQPQELVHGPDQVMAQVKAGGTHVYWSKV